MALAVYQISFLWKKTKPDVGQLQAKIDSLSDDWGRLNENVWFVLSSRGVDEIYEGVRSLMHTDDSVIVIKVDPFVRQGWAPKVIWDWIDRVASRVG